MEGRMENNTIATVRMDKDTPQHWVLSVFGIPVQYLSRYDNPTRLRAKARQFNAAYNAAVEEAVASERERCAKIAESLVIERDGSQIRADGDWIASVIRSSSEAKEKCQECNGFKLGPNGHTQCVRCEGSGLEPKIRSVSFTREKK